MTTYLLLRDNKESGPYSLDDLKQKGLKAYDLVWVEGKSAAWRYPCEVEELSSFAPAVEEQPFDRFYKKPARENAAAVPSVPNVPSVSNGSSIFSGEPSAVPGKRIIYVTLPAGKGGAVIRDTATREPVKAPAVFQDRQSLPVDASAPIPVSAEIPLPNGYYAEDKSAQAREDWNAGVEILPRAGKRRDLSGIIQPVAVGLCILALLAAGIFIGLSINKYNINKFIVASPQKTAFKSGPTNLPAAIDHPAGFPAPAPSAASALQIQASVTDSIKTAPLTQAAVTNPQKPAGGKEKSSLSAQKKPAALSSATDSAMTALTVVSREATHRTDQPVEKIDKDILRNNLSNLVSVGTNGYTVGAFGGISGVQMTVSNKSVYPLDLVVVEVQYVQANKKVFKTENLYFRGIGPGSALMLEAPNSSRGIKVQYRITLVHSKEIGLSYSTR